MNFPDLNPEKALIWRILHRENIDWVLENGLHAGNSGVKAPRWVSIGNQELIDKRASHAFLGGLLGDYVPFYFTPFSPMLLNIVTGRNGVRQLPQEDIVILVSSIHRLVALRRSFLFSDSHAYNRWASFYSDPADLHRIAWRLLQQRDFKRDPEQPDKLDLYQAEALVRDHVPLDALFGMVCYTDIVRDAIAAKIAARHLTLKVHTRPQLYF
jgi:hypothetical protein